MPTYEQSFRESLGFTNKEKLKKYFKANDICIINWKLIKDLNIRLKDMSSKINNALPSEIQIKDISLINKKLMMHIKLSKKIKFYLILIIRDEILRIYITIGCVDILYVNCLLMLFQNFSLLVFQISNILEKMIYQILRLFPEPQLQICK